MGHIQILGMKDYCDPWEIISRRITSFAFSKENILVEYIPAGAHEPPTLGGSCTPDSSDVV